MQVPTLRNAHIRNARDALAVFNGVATNVLPLITRRLDAEERRAIAPGNIYVWEERETNAGVGMERWTDGMGWGPSRVRDEFLFYQQKETELGEDIVPSTPWAQMISVYPATYSCAATESERLIKQTYSVHVSLPEDISQGISRKWHMTAYFSQQKLDTGSLATIDTIPGVGDVAVPDGWFKSARTVKTKRGNRDKAPLTALHPSSGVGALSSSRPVSAHSRHPSDSSKSSSSPSPSEDSPLYAVPTILGQAPSVPVDLLVPLQHLHTISYTRRDPLDEQLLMRLSSSRSKNRRLPPGSS